MNNNEILVISAHPDDLCLGAGGFVYKLSKEGKKVYSLILGQENYYARDQISPMENTKEQELACSKFLNYEIINYGNFSDNAFDEHSLLSVSKFIEKNTKNINPNIIITHYSQDLNIDHRISHQATMTAFRSLPKKNFFFVYAMEVLSSTEWSEQFFKPNTYINLSDEEINTKIKAFSCYRTEIRDWPHPRSRKIIKSKAIMRGSESGCRYAEAFQLIKCVK